jgi:O-antigen ligase
MGNPNGMGLLLVSFFLLYQVVVFRFPKIFDRKQKILFLIVFAISLLLCQSRSAIFVSAAFYPLAFLFKKNLKLGMVSVILTFLVVNLVSFDIVSILQNFGLQDYLRAETLKDGSGRLIAWQFAWEQIQKDFFIGGGFNYSDYIFGKYTLILSNAGHQGNVHNSFLTMWLDLGLIGIILFVSPLIYIIFQSSKTCYLAFPVLFCFLFTANFESWLVGSLNPVTSIFIICILLMTNIPEKESEKAEIQPLVKELN